MMELKDKYTTTSTLEVEVLIKAPTLSLFCLCIDSTKACIIL